MNSAEIAATLGLDHWICKGEGIGGVIKVRPADFRVTEVGSTPALDPKGRFTVARITLDNWETNRFVNRLAKALKISRKRIWFSGTKDKRAVTTQLFVIDSHQNKIADVEIKDVSIEILGRTHQKLSMGDHSLNRFSITVRGCAHEDGTPMNSKDVQSQVEEIHKSMVDKLGYGYFPNWVGPQRFGSTRPVTPVVGRHVVNGEWEEAVNAYLGMEGLNEQKEVAEFRLEWRTNRDVEKALEIIPKQLGYERDMLYSLKKKPGNWVAAFRRLPNNLQLMTIHSLQSLAFNHLLGERISQDITISQPIIGDVVGPIDKNSKLDTKKLATVSEDILPRIVRNCQLGRLVVTGTLMGTSGSLSEGTILNLEQIVSEKLALNNITWEIDEIPRLTTRGTQRPLAGHYQDFSFEMKEPIDLTEDSQKWSNGPGENDQWHPEGACVRFTFSLPPGTYATTLLREFTRVPIHQS